jgi:hypothetical protein
MYDFNVDPYDDPQLLDSLQPEVKARLQKMGADLSRGLDRLADANFALVVIDEESGEKMRKFACSDAGNTAKSAFYLLAKGEHLPYEARKIAAANIIRALDDYNMEKVEALTKMASERPPQTNVFVTKISNITPRRQTAGPSTLTKSASALQSADDVRAAISYFDENSHILTGWEKRALAKQICSADPQELSKTAAAKRHDLFKYASDTYDAGLAAAIIERQMLCSTSLTQHAKNDELVKVASASLSYQDLFALRDSLNPTQFAQQLERLDKEAGLVGKVKDAVYTTFGKVAQEEDPIVFSNQATKLTRDQLKWFVSNRYREIKAQFGLEIADAMMKDPEAIFASLPTPQKSIMARMVSQDYGDNGTQTSAMNARL